MFVSAILVGVRGGVNLGMIARSALNFNIDDLRLVQPGLGDSEWKTAEIYSSHGKKKIEEAEIFDTLEDALKDIDLAIATSAKSRMMGSNILRRAIRIQDLERMLEEKDVTRTALVFGREDSGLTNREIDRCHLLLTIEASGSYRTLNIASAAAILFHSLYLIRRGEKKHRIPGKGNRERAVAYFEALARLTILNEGRVERAVRAFSHILNRALPDDKETSLILGVLRKSALLLGRHK